MVVIEGHAQDVHARGRGAAGAGVALDDLKGCLIRLRCVGCIVLNASH
jgi:hypothetical protein